MKALKLFSIVMMGMAITLASCSGEDGKDGGPGAPGDDGENGISCWDTNGNRIADADEDINQDGNFNGLDCQGAVGNNGDNGLDGISCWDTNGDGIADANEDINEDGNFDGLDCQGADGNANVEERAFNLDMFSNYTALTLDLHDLVEVPENYAYLYYIDSSIGLRYSLPGHLTDNEHYARVYTDLSTGELNIKFYDALNDNPVQIAGGWYTHVIVITIELTNGSKNSQNVMDSLKSAGVDVSNYEAVAAYFGLK